MTLQFQSRLLKRIFRWLHFDTILHKLRITVNDLVPIADLPPPEESYRVLEDAGKAHFVFDLGTAFLNPWRLPKDGRAYIVDLGTC